MTSTSLPLLWSIITFLFFTLLPPTSSLNNASGTTKFRREVIVKRHGAVATDDGRCSIIGMDVLREGGNVIDAAVAATLCLGVVSPASSGLGGGGLMLIRLANGKTQFIDMREIATMRASENMYGGNATLQKIGALAVAVPGQLAGLHKAWKEHGKLPWERLVRPAEKLARMGFKISPFLKKQMEETKSGILADKGLRDIFTLNGNLLQLGDICSNKKLAETLRKISKYGLKAFYNGSIGFNLVRDVRKAGGIVTVKDLQRYEAKMREPISANIFGLKVIGIPPPSSGGASMILMLNILSQYGPSGLSGPLGIHRQIEALKHVFAVRMNLGDPDFVNVTEVVSDMLSPKFAEELKKKIHDNMTFGPDHYGGRWNQIHDHGTSHLSIVDSERNALAFTTSVNDYFGAQLLSPSTGIILNNQMDDFSMPMNSSDAEYLPPAPANFIRPGKRPLSSMTTTILLKDDKLKAVMGASGGSLIIGGTTEVFLNHFVRGMDPLSSVMAPRIYHELIPNIVCYENWTTVTGDHIEVPGDIREALIKKGHVLQIEGYGSNCQFIVQDLEGIEENGGLGELTAVSDVRKGGFPAGY